MPETAFRLPRSLPDRPHPPLRPGLAPPARTSAASSEHSRRVALLKRVLPAAGVALLLLVAIWPRLAGLWEGMRMRWPAIDLRDARELRMIDPRYVGVDRRGHPFAVTAAVGRQVPDHQELMSLQAPRAEIRTHGGAEITITSATGVYQSQAQLLDLFGKVTVVHQNGTRLITDAARVDAAHNTAQGSDPVEGHGPTGDVKAQGFRILDRGDTILFTGRTDMLLKGAKPAALQGSPPALPAPIAASAARAAAEARPAPTAARRARPVPAGRPHLARATAARRPPAPERR